MTHPTYPQGDVCPPESLPDDLVRVLGPDGALVAPTDVPDDVALDLHRAMVRQRLIDERMLTLQRQGRIGFYGACTGQEAAVFGTAAALAPTDWIVPALREAGALLYRGLPLSTYFHQLLGSRLDVTQGRQMPCHPPGHDFHYVTMSSVIANQIPQACGLALAGKLRADGRVTAVYMGDGATSEGDFHTGMNMAALQRLPMVLVCQNNQWSISVPVGRQTASRSFAIKAHGYGMPGIRVDGNDALAVYAAMRDAVARARQGEGPTLIECLTYRLGAHTTSDDPTRYRDEAVTERWKELDPLIRTRRYLTARGRWSDAEEAALREGLDQQIRATWAEAEQAPPPELDSIFLDVFAAPTPQQREQLDGLKRNYAWAEGRGWHRPLGHG